MLLHTMNSFLRRTQLSILDSFDWHKVSHDQNLILTAVHSAEEVKDAVFGLYSSRSPGADGFGGSFYHQCWPIIATDVTRAIVSLFETNCIPYGMNSNLVTLIPKVENSVRITDFWPIVVGNFHYEVYTKILATRMGSFIGTILSDFQFGFVPGRRIHSCIALASDAVNFLDLGRKGHMVLKVDITKAFDTISWGFLFKVLRCMHFSDRFVNMIHNILLSLGCPFLLTTLLTDTSPALVVFDRETHFLRYSFAWRRRHWLDGLTLRCTTVS